MSRFLIILSLIVTCTLDASPASDLFERMKSLAGE
jgi:hypothetical protein